MGLFDFFRKAAAPPPTSNLASGAVTGNSAKQPSPTSSGLEAPTSLTPVRSGRTLLIHGYSASGGALEAWGDRLSKANIPTQTIEIGNYITLNNEVSIKDLGEAFDRALRLTKWSDGSKDEIWTFDAIVHSTGMLVLRQWLASDPFPRDDPRSRIKRLKHLIGLAPATWGSPQAKKGRSWLGSLVKGNKDVLGPDFLNAGDRVLDGLELASSYTWELAHKDMICPRPLYGKEADTPYVAIFIGNIPYEGVAALSNSPGSDGTIRWAGCALNTRKVTVDLRREPKLLDKAGKPTRYDMTTWIKECCHPPIIAVERQNHGTIVSEPNEGVARLVLEFFFNVTDAKSYLGWESEAKAFGADARRKMDAASVDGKHGGAGWQQLIVHMVDDHGDPVPDYNVQLFFGNALSESDDASFAPIPIVADTYSGDSSYRCFYIRLEQAMLDLGTAGNTQKLWLELIASSGSDMIEYEAYTTADGPSHPLSINHRGGTPVKLDISGLVQGDESLLYPYTTTLLEIFVEREPLPLGRVSELFNFIDPKTKKPYAWPD